jgi:hypothetical protein
MKEIRWAGYVAGKEKIRNAPKFGGKILGKTRPLGRRRLNGKILIKLILKNSDGNVEQDKMHQCSGQWPPVLVRPKNL